MLCDHRILHTFALLRINEPSYALIDDSQSLIESYRYFSVAQFQSSWKRKKRITNKNKEIFWLLWPYCICILHLMKDANYLVKMEFDQEWFSGVCVCVCVCTLGFGCCVWAPLVVVGGLSCPVTCGVLVPQRRIKPASPALKGRVSTTRPPEKYPDLLL